MAIKEAHVTRRSWVYGACAALALITGCSKPHDFSGTYVVTTGNGCTEDGSGGREPVLMSISPGSGGADEMVYTAHLSQLAAAMRLPLDSRPTKVSEDGSLNFEFFEEGKAGVFSARPSKHVHMKLVVRDGEHLLLESWPVIISMPGSPQPEAEFDLVKDDLLDLPGFPRKVPNEFSKVAGDKGLCLRQKG